MLGRILPSTHLTYCRYYQHPEVRPQTPPQKPRNTQAFPFSPVKESIKWKVNFRAGGQHGPDPSVFAHQRICSQAPKPVGLKRCPLIIYPPFPFFLLVPEHRLTGTHILSHLLEFTVYHKILCGKIPFPLRNG